MKENRFVTFHREPTQWLNPVQLSSGSLLRLSTQPTTLLSVISTLKLLNPDDYLEFMLDYYEEGLKKFDNCWDYADLLTVLQAAATVLKPQNYLEIGDGEVVVWV